MENLRFCTHVKLVLLFLLIFTIPLLDREKKVIAQETDMSLVVHETQSIIIGGVTFLPLQTKIHRFEAGVTGSFSFTNLDGSFVIISFSADTTTVPVDFIVSSYAREGIISLRPLPLGLDAVGAVLYDFTAFDGLTEKKTFNSDFTAEFHYSDSQITGFEEGTLKTYFLDDSQAIWIQTASLTLDQTNNTISISRDHLTLFGIFGQLEIEDTTIVGVGGGSVFRAGKTVDYNNDGRVDILDFNILMVHWGETKNANPIDINSDNIVDILDLNLLMVQWTVEG